MKKPGALTGPRPLPLEPQPMEIGNDKRQSSGPLGFFQSNAGAAISGVAGVEKYQSGFFKCGEASRAAARIGAAGMAWPGETRIGGVRRDKANERPPSGRLLHFRNMD